MCNCATLTINPNANANSNPNLDPNPDPKRATNLLTVNQPKIALTLTLILNPNSCHSVRNNSHRCQGNSRSNASASLKHVKQILLSGVNMYSWMIPWCVTFRSRLMLGAWCLVLGALLHMIHLFLDVATLGLLMHNQWSRGYFVNWCQHSHTSLCSFLTSLLSQLCIALVPSGCFLLNAVGGVEASVQGAYYGILPPFAEQFFLSWRFYHFFMIFVSRFCALLVFITFWYLLLLVLSLHV